MTRIDVSGVEKQYQQTDAAALRVLDGVQFTTDENDFVCILGPSGCGKSTLMNIIAGLETPTTGAVTVGDETENTDVCFVFQEPRLLDWRTVRKNVEIALAGKGVPESEWDDRIQQYLELVGLGSFADEYPRSLSGGMQQRVSIARAMAVEPDVILMDEPFSSVDEITARQLRSDLVDIWEDQQRTIVFVTHDATEATYLANRVLVMSHRPSEVLVDEKIDIDRPRSVDDPTLVELAETFVGELETRAGAQH
ncbi:ABC transporter ATP-binding protein [Halobacterium noricense]|uniref:ABC transporter ATP-binding protein n=1 Tax=Halobacterium noricense TaxID=223182 RepID=UPI001E3B1762|nr:ABC transporter ATP-binding protein [Halobacterium noricense]UHH24787.1 ABC transporter ATP-binding protein [Halobacterium noricense]